MGIQRPLYLFVGWSLNNTTTASSSHKVLSGTLLTSIPFCWLLSWTIRTGRWFELFRTAFCRVSLEAKVQLSKASFFLLKNLFRLVYTPQPWLCLLDLLRINLLAQTDWKDLSLSELYVCLCVGRKVWICKVLLGSLEEQLLWAWMCGRTESNISSALCVCLWGFKTGL